MKPADPEQKLAQVYTARNGEDISFADGKFCAVMPGSVTESQVQSCIFVYRV